MTQCDALQLKCQFLESSTSSDGASLVKEGVEVVFRVSIPSSERTALLLQSTGECGEPSYLAACGGRST